MLHTYTHAFYHTAIPITMPTKVRGDDAVYERWLILKAIVVADLPDGARWEEKLWQHRRQHVCQYHRPGNPSRPIIPASPQWRTIERVTRQRDYLLYKKLERWWQWDLPTVLRAYLLRQALNMRNRVVCPPPFHQ